METNKILTADVLDIIFDGKNKAYGAYQLRRSYQKTLTRAMTITGSFLLLALGGSVLANMINDDGNARRYDTIETAMAVLKKEEPVLTPPPPPPPPKEIKLDLKQVRFTPPIIRPDNEIKPDETVKDLEPDAAISIQNVESNNTKQIVQAPVDESNTQVLEIKKADEENEILTIVQIEAAFPGGEDAWRSYLRKTLNAETPIDNGATAGKYTVIVKFVVSKDGTLSDIKCENDPGFGMCEEAIRVVKKTKNWIPAVQMGRNVNAYRRQPIVFVVEE